MASCLIGLGANLQDRAAAIQQAIQAIAAHQDVRLLAQSQLHETAPIGGPAGQDDFLNAAALFETSLSPFEMHRLLIDVETDLGRQRHERWGARSIDLDLLLYDQLQLESETLTIPHPRMSFRRFVIEPAAEIAPDMTHPTVGWTLAELRDHLGGHQPYVAITGPIGVGKSHLARRLGDECGARRIEEGLPHQRLTDFYAAVTEATIAEAAERPDSPSRQDATAETGPVWSTEIEFLQERTEQLEPTRVEKLSAEAGPPSTTPGLVVSDYWFDQSLAFARVWLPPQRHAEYHSRWAAARRTVATPKLLVVLDAPVETLMRSVAERGRPYETELSAEMLGRLRESLLELVDQGGHGPLLRLTLRNQRDAEQAFDEVAAAIGAMQ